MTTLVQDLGARYVREMFASALFEMDGKLHRLRSIDDVQAAVDTINPQDKTPKWERTYIPADRLVNFATFKYPKLGYRQFKQGKIGNIVVMASTLRSTSRGLKEDLINYQQLPIYNTVDLGYHQGWSSVNDTRRVVELFRPTFTPFSVGIKELLSGESLGFAVSEDLAVGLSVTIDQKRHADVYYRGRVVGNVDESGTVNIVNKVLQRESLKKKLFK